MSRCFRYVPFTILQDRTAWPEYRAVCVAGEDADCGADSGELPGPAQVEEWARKHTQDTGHLRYRRTFSDYMQLEPPEDLMPVMVSQGETVEHARAIEASPMLRLARASATS